MPCTKLCIIHKCILYKNSYINGVIKETLKRYKGRCYCEYAFSLFFLLNNKSNVFKNFFLIIFLVKSIGQK